MPLVYVFHVAYFAVFLLRLAGRPPAPAAAPIATADTATSARHPRALFALHGVGFFVLYFGLGHALFSPRPWLLFARQPVVGGAVIVAAGALLAWTLLVFRSWRFLARIETGHQLSTDGPFRIVRHPIYLSLDLLALGTFLWAPSPLVLAGALLVAAGGDLRARGEERALVSVFGEEYLRYQRRVARTIPGLY